MRCRFSRRLRAHRHDVAAPLIFFAFSLYVDAFQKPVSRHQVGKTRRAAAI